MIIINDLWLIIKSFIFKNKYHINYDNFVNNFNKSIYKSFYFNKYCLLNIKYKNKNYSINPFHNNIQYCSWPIINQLIFLKYIAKNKPTKYNIENFLYIV